jgi:hypothetical protein
VKTFSPLYIIFRSQGRWGQAQKAVSFLGAALLRLVCRGLAMGPVGLRVPGCSFLQCSPHALHSLHATNHCSIGATSNANRA